ncbi:MAG: EVE domain-containing protein [Ignavibacteria bacterium]|nr:EVE domain-containing protein [Ignavibacteria bacterium]
MSTSHKYWVVVACKDHIMKGVEGGFMQANHGKEAPLKRISKGDRVLFYASKQEMNDKAPYQKFVAIGEICDENIEKVQMSADFEPFRRNIEFKKSKEVEIRPLIEKLEFIKNKKSWGFIFRFGFFEIPEQDFKLISSLMSIK